MNVAADGDGVLEKRNMTSKIPSGYFEHDPPADLAGQVVCFWTRLPESHAPAESRIHRVLPDGCVDIVIGFGGDGASGARSLEVTQAMGVGAMTQPIVISGRIPDFYV